MKCPAFNLRIDHLLKFLLFVVLMSTLTGCSSRRTIVNGLDEKEANEILVFLAGKGIDANKEAAATDSAGGTGKGVLWNISVPSDNANEAMALLNQAGLPRRRGQNLLGIFSNVGLVPSGMEQKVRYQAGLAEQLANTIRKIDGILDADVQISFPEDDPLNPTAPKQKITASVYVKHSGVLDDPNAHLVTRIKRLVAGSINGLDYDNVTVIGDKARFVEPSSLQGSIGEEEKSYVNVWSILLASESVSRFRIIFFSFIVSIVILFLLLSWLIWKFYPVLKEAGGFKQLFNYHPIQPENIAKKTTEENVTKENEDEAQKAEEDEKGIDET